MKGILIILSLFINGFVFANNTQKNATNAVNKISLPNEGKFYELINCAYLSNETKNYRQSKQFLDSAEEIANVLKDTRIFYDLYLSKGVVFFNKSIEDDAYTGAAIKNLSEAFKLSNSESLKKENRYMSDLFLITDLLNRCYAKSKIPYFFNDKNDDIFKDETKLSEKISSLFYITQKVIFTRKNPVEYEQFISKVFKIKDLKLQERCLSQIGLAYKSMNEYDSSAKYLSWSSKISFKNPNRSLEARLVEDIKDKDIFDKKTEIVETAENTFCAIEIGSKGVKMVILSVNHDYQGNYNYITKFDSAINTEFITFTSNAMRETIAAVDKFFLMATDRFQVTTKHVFLAISSGVYDMAYKKEDNENPVLLKELSKKVRERLFTKYNEVVHVITITPDVEANLIHLGTVHKEEKEIFLIVDIGSGNTKGGSFNSDGGFTSFTFPLGTSSYSDSVARATNKFESINDFEATNKKLSENYIKQSVRDATKGGTSNKSHILFTGGISWAICRVMYPENQDRAYLKTSIADVELFRKKLLTELDDIEAFKKDLLSDIYDQKTREKAEKQIKLVFNAFDQQKLLAGSQILLEIMKQFNSVAPKKVFALAPNGYIGWITGVIIKEMSGSL